MSKEEMMVTVNGGWLHCKVNAKTASAGFDRLLEAFDDAGIDVSNIEFGSCELRNEDGDTIDKFHVNPERRHSYDCNHDCDALYQAYEKGKHDERNRILKAILCSKNGQRENKNEVLPEMWGER